MMFNLQEAFEEVVRRRLVLKGHVLVVKRWRDDLTHNTFFELSNGKIVAVTDHDAQIAMENAFREKCRDAGALVYDDVEEVSHLLEKTDVS